MPDWTVVNVEKCEIVLEKFGLWLTVMVPLVCSAGPINVTFAASAAQFEIIKLLAFTLSTRIIFSLNP